MQEERLVRRPCLPPAAARLGLGLALLALTSRPLPIRATATATITVNTTADELNSDGDCSLREAIQAANTDAAVDACPAGGGADTITFHAATDGIPIVLSGAAAENANASGDLDILDGGDLTIQGNGAANTIIDGGGIDRVFHVCPGGGCAGAVTLSGVTVRNGSVGGLFGSGGGILNGGATLNVQDSTVSANTATSGGGIYNRAKLTIQSSTIGGAGAGNTAITGGGIYNVVGGVVTLNASVVSANTASFAGGIYNKFLLVVQYGSIIGGASAGNTATGDGGGIYNTTGGSTGVSGSSVSANTADRGGGIYNQAQLNVRNGSTIGGAGAGNTADTFGGGIYNETGTTTVDGSTVSANTALHGGGIDNYATLNVQNGSTIGGAGAGNTAIEGGGINNDSGGTTTVAGSTVSGNTAGWGGGIFNRATLNVQNGGTIGGVGAGNTVTSSGGGIYNLAGITTLEGSIVSANTATDGGGIYVEAGAMIVDGSTVSANMADNGGGIYNKATPLNVQNGSTIGGAGAGNTATTNGGGIYNETGTTTVDDSTVSANMADYGGGVFNQATLNVQNGSAIGGAGVGNTATTNGGGIFNQAGTTTVDTSTVSANAATDGGGIYNQAALNVQNGSAIGQAGAGNNATNQGGGIYSDNTGTTTVVSSAVHGNTAEIGGGGIYNDTSSTTTVDASTVSANVAGWGGGIASLNATLNVQNGSTIGGAGGGNTATAAGGGGLYNSGVNGTVTVDASRVSANTAENGGGIINWWGVLNVQNGSTIGGVGSGNTATNHGGGIYNANGGTAIVVDSRILQNRAANGGAVYSNNASDGATTVTASCIVGNSDTAFFNYQVQQQIATGDWWGAATGPNTPGADTVDGNVDTSGFLTAPILGCTPDLQVTKANDTGGETTVGTPFHWTLTIGNAGLTHAVFNTGQEILVDELPAGPAYGAPTVADLVNVTGGANIDCSIAGNSLTCEAKGGGVTVGTAGGFAVGFSVTPGEAGALSNPAGICQVDPDGNVTESDENNNCPTDTVEVTSHSIYLPLVVRNLGAPQSMG